MKDNSPVSLSEEGSLDHILYWQSRAREEIKSTLPGVVNYEHGERIEQIKNRHINEAKAAIHAYIERMVEEAKPKELLVVDKFDAGYNRGIDEYEQAIKTVLSVIRTPPFKVITTIYEPQGYVHR